MYYIYLEIDNIWKCLISRHRDYIIASEKRKYWNKFIGFNCYMIDDLQRKLFAKQDIKVIGETKKIG